jgi:hypothetical protein
MRRSGPRWYVPALNGIVRPAASPTRIDAAQPTSTLGCDAASSTRTSTFDVVDTWVPG